MSVTVRPMTEADVEAAGQVQVAAFDDLDRRQGREPRKPTDTTWERVYARQRHFLTHDPAGSWAAADGDQVVGSALALRRESFWGLSLLVVDPSTQATGIGRRLLDASLTYAEGCDRAVIMSSTDVRAMRSYATSGFQLYPQVGGAGIPDATTIPALHTRVREGSVADVEFADAVDRAVRGAPRGPDQLQMAKTMAMFIVDDVDGRGYAYVRTDGELSTLAATDDETATALLWRCLAHNLDIDKPATVFCMTAEQQWAIGTTYRARLKVEPAGPVFWRGATPPRAYLPSGAYL